jgi:hypothetical protein
MSRARTRTRKRAMPRTVTSVATGKPVPNTVEGILSSWAGKPVTLTRNERLSRAMGTTVDVVTTPPSKQSAAATKAWETIRERKKRGLGTIKEAQLACKAAGGHRFDNNDGKCSRCGTAKPSPRTFARLEYMQWWDRSMRDTWRRIGVEMCRVAARTLLKGMIGDDDFNIDPDDDAIRVLTEAAMIDHRLRHPTARGDRLWMYADQKRGHADVRCRFCHAVLRRAVKLGATNYDNVIEVRDHVTDCAITALATNSSKPPIAAKRRQ